MKVDREQLLTALESASVALSSKEILEQSNCFVFKKDRIIAFNDEIMASVDNPTDLDAVVGGEDLVKMLSKFPDDHVEIAQNSFELLIKGKRKEAGLKLEKEILLPYDAVPVPEPSEWKKLGEGISDMLQQAARTCGNDETQPLTTHVHLTPSLVEASDNYRLFRASGATGLPGGKEGVLIPASVVASLDGLPIEEVGLVEGWCHFRTGEGEEFSVRCSHQKYHTGVEQMLNMDGAETVKLPSNLTDILGRAEIMSEAGYDARMSVEIEDGEFRLTARKEGGWYREKKRVQYKGSLLSFEVHPRFLAEIFSRARKVQVTSRRLMIQVDNIEFVVSLNKPSPKEE